jgi:membrane-associated protease RseP (regulator of RpoE activity)
MTHRILLCVAILTLVASVQSAEIPFDRPGEAWSWGYGGEEGGGGSSYLGVDIADVTTERLSALKLKEEHGAEVTMVDQDAPAGKAGLKEHDVILSLNGAAVESAAQLRRMIRETPAGRVVSLGISREGQTQAIKVQLANRSKNVAGVRNVPEIKFAMPAMPALADLDLPVSVVIAHSSLRSGLMVENITPQLGDFFGVKGGSGVLVRSVEKGSRSEKAGFHAGDVIVRVNNQSVHDTSDFTRALRATSAGAAAVTVVRDKREQNLTLTLPDKKDSGDLLEESFEFPELNADAEMELSRAGAEMARMAPALEKLQRDTPCYDKMQRKMQDSQKKFERQSEKLRREFAGEWTEI